MDERSGSDNRAGKKLSAQPLYAQLRDMLIKRVTSGIWRPGDAIPNEIELAREFNLSPGTVRRALDLMERARIIVRHQGRGTYVTDPSEAALATRFDAFHHRDGSRIAFTLAHTHITQAEARDAEIKNLRLAAKDPVHRISQVRLHRDLPFMVEQVSVPVSVFAQLPSHDTGYDLVRAAIMNNVLLGSGEEQVSLEAATADVAQQLKIAEGASVIALERIVYSVDDVPVEMRHAWCNPGQAYYHCVIN